MIATFNGATIFGLAVNINVVLNPPAGQVTSFFGISGQQNLFGGLRGRVIECEGLLAAPDVPTLNAARATFESYLDGYAYTLVDILGNAWPNVLLDQFVPGKAMNGGSAVYLPYRALFRSLT